jgi:hypothetical protein
MAKRLARPLIEDDEGKLLDVQCVDTYIAV